MVEITKKVVKHYKRVSNRTFNKGIVTELIQKNSDTHTFLIRMEVRRLGKPCHLPLDMRGKVPAECKRYKLQGKIFFLDNESYRIYKECVEEDDDIFTVRAYEAIINGPHTYRGMETAKKQAQIAQQAKRQQQQKQSSVIEKSPQTPAVINQHIPSIIQFGYFRKRSEGRLKYATKVKVHKENYQFQGVTRDISTRGLQVMIKEFCSLETGMDVKVDFMTLQSTAPASVTLVDTDYHIVAKEKRDNAIILRMARQDEENSDRDAFSKFISGLVERYSHKYKLDVEDDYNSMVATLLERMYTENATQVPLFISQQNNKSVLQKVGRTSGNDYLLQTFKNQHDEYDFSSLALPHRLKRLLENNEFLLIMYKDETSEDKSVISMADFEFSSPLEERSFINYCLSQPEYLIVKICNIQHPMRHPDFKKIESQYQKLMEKSSEFHDVITKNMEELSSVALLVDVSEQIEEYYDQEISDEALMAVDELRYWAGNQFHQNDKVLKEIELSHKADDVMLSYREGRLESRYMAKTSIVITAGKQILQGNTVDISVGGLLVTIDTIAKLIEGDEISVALTTLQKKRANVNLKKIPYIIVKIFVISGVTHVHLKRSDEKRSKEVDKFFIELIENNKGKLAVCYQDLLKDVSAQSYETLWVNNMTSVPLFMIKNEQGSVVFDSAALPENQCKVCDFFSNPEGQIDFSPINRSHVIATIYDQVVLLNRSSSSYGHRPPPSEMMIYMCRGFNKQGKKVTYAKAECEFKKESEKILFINKAIQFGEYCFIKILTTWIKTLKPEEVDHAVDIVRNNSKNKATYLRELIFKVVAIGEMFDMTDMIESCYRNKK